jgi:hypothetical protein
MENAELIHLWKTYNRKMDETLIIHKQTAEDITKIKVLHVLGSMKPIKIFTIIIGFLWFVLGAIALTNIYLHAWAESSKFFLFSTTIQIILTAVALGLYIYQLILIYQVDISDAVINTQEKIAKLKSSTLLITRILILQLPVWTSFWWTEQLLRDWNLLQWIIAASVFFLATFVSLWLFFNIRYENRDKKWFKLIFSGREWTPLLKAMSMLEHIEEYKNQPNDPAH